MRYRRKGYDDSSYGRWAPYVPVAERRRKAQEKIARLKKKGQVVAPVIVQGRKIADTFWGKAWCENLEAYSDYSNRLPRGRTYVRNGSVIDLQITEGKIKGLVQGSSLYEVEIDILPVDTGRWLSLVEQCSGKIDSLVELLRGRFEANVMTVVTNPTLGLFPTPKQIKLKCSCPDWATMCKHVAAVLYGAGARLDERPELLFLLRKANHLDLIANASVVGSSIKKGSAGKAKVIEQSKLSAVFGIELDSTSASAEVMATPQRAMETKKKKRKGKTEAMAPRTARKKNPVRRSRRS